MKQDLDPEDLVIIKMIALFCASTALSGNVCQSSTVIKMAKKFEDYLKEEAK